METRDQQAQTATHELIPASLPQAPPQTSTPKPLTSSQLHPRTAPPAPSPHHCAPAQPHLLCPQPRPPPTCPVSAAPENRRLSRWLRYMSARSCSTGALRRATLRCDLAYLLRAELDRAPPQVMSSPERRGSSTDWLAEGLCSGRCSGPTCSRRQAPKRPFLQMTCGGRGG